MTIVFCPKESCKNNINGICIEGEVHLEETVLGTLGHGKLLYCEQQTPKELRGTTFISSTPKSEDKENFFNANWPTISLASDETRGEDS